MPKVFLKTALKKVYTFKNLTVQFILCKSFPTQSFLTGSSSTFPLHWRTQRTKMDYSPLFSTSLTVKDKDFLVAIPLQVFNWLKFPHLICNLWTTAFNIQHHHNIDLFMRAQSFQLRPVLALSLFWKILLHKNNRAICSQSYFLWEVTLNNLKSYVPVKLLLMRHIHLDVKHWNRWDDTSSHFGDAQQVSFHKLLIVSPFTLKCLLVYISYVWMVIHPRNTQEIFKLWPNSPKQAITDKIQTHNIICAVKKKLLYKQ